MEIMSNKYKGNTKNRGKAEGYKAACLRMLPVLLIVGLVPLIVWQTSYETMLENVPWFGNEEISYEFFLAPKSLILTLLMFVMAVVVGVRVWKEKKKIPFVKLLIPLFGYGVLALLSGCFSVNRHFSFSGGYEHFETVWVLLCYVFIVYYVFLYAQTETELQVVTDAICFGATVIGVLGTMQGLGFDYMTTKPVQKLITTEDFLYAIGGELTINFGNNQAYATLYNPNYLGVFGSFVLPFLAMLILYEKNKWRRIWHCADFILVAVATLSSRSRAGLIAAVAALCVALVLAVRAFIKWWYLTIPAINLAVVILLLVNAYNDNLLFDRLKNVFQKDDTTVSEYIAEDGTVVKQTGLTEMITSPDGVVLTYNETRVLVSLYEEDDVYWVYAIDEDMKQMELLFHKEDGTYTFTAPALAGVKAAPAYIGEGVGLSITAAGKDWNFVYNESKEQYQYFTDFGKESDMIMAVGSGFEDWQSTFSGRGYIWSRTLPILKDHIFLGSGPDTFLLEFPQEDYLMMYKNGFANQVMTKPHSWYLQVGVQTGVLSLLCLLVFYGWYAVWSLRLYAFRKLGTQLEAFGIAAFIGSIGYMISGISNDSMVVTAPVFWGMIALGLTANVLVAKHRKQEIPVTEQKK